MPEEFGDGQQLVALHAFQDVNAVDAERGQLREQLLICLVLAVRRDPVEEHIASDDVDANRVAGSKQPGDHVFELFELLPDHRVSGRIRPGQLAQTGNPPQYGEWIERRRGSGGRHRALSSRAFSATCTRLGFQNLKRSPSSLVSVSSSPCTRD